MDVPSNYLSDFHTKKNPRSISEEGRKKKNETRRILYKLRKELKEKMLMEKYCLLNIEDGGKAGLSLGTAISKLIETLQANDSELAWKKIFLKKERHKLHYDDKRHQVVVFPEKETLLQIDPADEEVRDEVENPQAVKDVCDLIMDTITLFLQYLLSEIFRDGINGPIPEHLTLLKSFPGGKRQQTHIDYSRYPEDLQDCCYVIIIPLTNSCKIHINRDATEYFYKNKTTKGFKKKLKNCKIETVHIKEGEILIFQNGLAHFGSDYDEMNVRLHLVFFPPDWTPSETHPNQTHIFTACK